jgi:tRNA A37 threonylcarbamoyladenosine dehydratase
MKINPIFQRLALLTGEEGLEKLKGASVLVFGLGGVGSWCAEALVRSGIGKIGIVDFDAVDAGNINRQVQATTLTLGLPKADVLKQRLAAINPECEITAWNKRFCRDNSNHFGLEKAGYVIDAIDSLNDKLDLIEIACAAGVNFFSSMGMARRLDPARIKTEQIWDTEGCPLARLVRQGLRKRGFAFSFTAVYSDEPQLKPAETEAAGKKVNGSAVTVTASAGMVLASLVLRDILEQQ